MSSVAVLNEFQCESISGKGRKVRSEKGFGARAEEVWNGASERSSDAHSKE